ncbi:MAG: hypothetical protein P1U56_13205 [Saprospiraceae bacterium]|nr:hypothetical protein [Saprospiraceae bacterium]
MNKIILVFALAVLTATIVKSQSQYEAGMQKAFTLWQEGKDTEALAMFERIGQVEKDNWVPIYHATNVLISSQFNEKDMVKKNEMLDKAKEMIAEAHLRSEHNSEITTLEGLLYTGYVAMDPGTFGMKYSPMIMQLHAKAVELDPNNPRAWANKIEYEMGSARFFGSDLTPFCAQMKEIIPKFENQKLEVPFAPSYGIERAKQVAESCNE